MVTALGRCRVRLWMVTRGNQPKGGRIGPDVTSGSTRRPEPPQCRCYDLPLWDPPVSRVPVVCAGPRWVQSRPGCLSGLPQRPKMISLWLSLHLVWGNRLGAQGALLPPGGTDQTQLQLLQGVGVLFPRTQARGHPSSIWSATWCRVPGWTAVGTGSISLQAWTLGARAHSIHHR